jgi:YidC/Oxa1 family membrane protein insertase
MNNNIINIVAAILLSAGIIFGWQYFYEKPKLEKLADEHKIYNKQMDDLTKKTKINEASIGRSDSQGTSDQRVKISSD